MFQDDRMIPVLSAVVLMIVIGTFLQRVEGVDRFLGTPAAAGAVLRDDELAAPTGALLTIDVFANDEGITPEMRAGLTVIAAPTCGRLFVRDGLLEYLPDAGCEGRQTIRYSFVGSGEDQVAAVTALIRASADPVAEGPEPAPPGPVTAGTSGAGDVAAGASAAELAVAGRVTAAAAGSPVTDPGRASTPPGGAAAGQDHVLASNAPAVIAPAPSTNVPPPQVASADPSAVAPASAAEPLAPVSPVLLLKGSPAAPTGAEMTDPDVTPAVVPTALADAPAELARATALPGRAVAPSGPAANGIGPAVTSTQEGRPQVEEGASPGSTAAVSASASGEPLLPAFDKAVTATGLLDAADSSADAKTAMGALDAGVVIAPQTVALRTGRSGLATPGEMAPSGAAVADPADHATILAGPSLPADLDRQAVAGVVPSSLPVAAVLPPHVAAGLLSTPGGMIANPEPPSRPVRPGQPAPRGAELAHGRAGDESPRVAAGRTESGPASLLAVNDPGAVAPPSTSDATGGQALLAMPRVPADAGPGLGSAPRLAALTPPHLSPVAPVQALSVGALAARRMVIPLPRPQVTGPGTQVAALDPRGPASQPGGVGGPPGGGGAGSPALPNAQCGAPPEMTLVIRGAAETVLGVNAPCNAATVAELSYSGLRLAVPLDGNGRGQVTALGFEPNAPALLSFTDGTALDFELPFRGIHRVSRVALVWDAPVELELNALEYGAAPSSPGHVRPGAARSFDEVRRTGGGYLTVWWPVAGVGQSVQVYSWFHRSGESPGIVKLLVDFVSRDRDRLAAACGSGPNAAPQFMVLRSVGGRPERPVIRQLAPLACGAVASEASDTRLISGAVEDLVITSR